MTRYQSLRNLLDESLDSKWMAKLLFSFLMERAYKPKRIYEKMRKLNIELISTDSNCVVLDAECGEWVLRQIKKLNSQQVKILANDAFEETVRMIDNRFKFHSTFIKKWGDGYVMFDF